MRKMRMGVVAALLLAMSLGGGVQAACPTFVPMTNVAGWQQNIGAGTGLGTTVLTKFWEVGAMGAANSGTLASFMMATAYNTGYYVSTDWANTGVVGCPCPSGVCGTNRTAFLYSCANSSGNAQYLIMSVGATGGSYNFDAITNGPGYTPTPLAIPKLSVVSYSWGGACHRHSILARHCQPEGLLRRHARQ